MKTVIEMAREAGLLTIGTADGSEAVYTWPKGITEELERFAELVRKDYSTTHANLWLDRIHKFMLEEREACAKVCEQGLAIATSLSALDDMEMWGEKFAAAIRARGNT
jgi:hypothetical protein